MSMSVLRKNIAKGIERLLWGVAAGRCEFRGCNRALYIHDITGVIKNLAEKAHIHAVKPLGARYIEQEKKDNIENLMLVCKACHDIIDGAPELYTAEYLYKMKIEHEKRIQILTAIGAEMKSHLIYYTANIADNRLAVDDGDAKKAITSIGRYPAEMRSIDISVYGSYIEDRDETYYLESVTNLQKAIKNQITDIIEHGKSVALFAIAPQPLLVFLGHQLNDKYNISVFQCHRRDNDKWSWYDEPNSVNFQNVFPHKTNSEGEIALVLAMSSSVPTERITSVIGKTAIIYVTTLDRPNRIFVTHPSIMDEFVEKSREILEKIKQTHGNSKTVHVFPVMPVSLAVRFGMDYMSKTDNPLIIYDEIAGKGFIPAIKIGDQHDK